jgi:hypothetical protein
LTRAAEDAARMVGVGLELAAMQQPTPPLRAAA